MRTILVLLILHTSVLCFAQNRTSRLNIPARYSHIDSTMFIYSQSREAEDGSLYHICFLINPTQDTLSYIGRKRNDTFWKTKYLIDNKWEETKVLGYCSVGTRTYDIPPNKAAAIKIYEKDVEAGILKFGMEFLQKGKFKTRKVKWTRPVEIK